MTHRQTRFLFLNVGHFLDHFFMLVFASVAALRLTSEWGISYAELIPYATPGFVAFGVGAIVAGWLADKWSREGMIAVFFIGIGASSILTGLANSPLQISIALALVGIFAAIYHPVGLAMVVQGLEKTGMPLAINGVFGNIGVASAALVTGFVVDNMGWRSAFFVPGVLSILIGFGYLLFLKNSQGENYDGPKSSKAKTNISRNLLVHVFAVIFFTTALGGLIFQSTTFSLPKIFDERLGDLATSATMVGWYAFLAFSLAAMAQLLIGYLVDRHSIKMVFAVVAFLQAVFFFVMIQLTGAYALLIAFCFMFVVFGQIPINDVLVGRMARSEWRSRAFALRYVVTFSVMALSVPMIAWIHGEWGFGHLFVLLGVAASLIFMAVLTLPKAAVANT